MLEGETLGCPRHQSAWLPELPSLRVCLRSLGAGRAPPALQRVQLTKVCSSGAQWIEGLAAKPAHHMVERDVSHKRCLPPPRAHPPPRATHLIHTHP